MPVVDGLPRPERRRHIPPRHTTPRPPEHPVEHRAVVGPPPTPTRGLIRQQRLQPSPLLIGQVMTMQHTKDLPHPALKIRGTRSSPMTLYSSELNWNPRNRVPIAYRMPNDAAIGWLCSFSSSVPRKRHTESDSTSPMPSETTARPWSNPLGTTADIAWARWCSTGRS